MVRSAMVVGAWPPSVGTRRRVESVGSWRSTDGGENRTGCQRRPLVVLLLILGTLLLFGAQAFAAPVVWVEPSLSRVAPDDSAKSTTDIHLYCAKGEFESFQIIVRAPDGGLTNVNVLAPDLTGPEFTLYREHYVYLSQGTTDWATNQNKPLGPGWYPDGLIPFVDPATGSDLTGAALDAVPFSLTAGKNQPIWIDVYVPRHVAAGNYSGTFTVTSDQGSATVTLNLTVWDFALPEKPALESAILLWTTRNQLQPEQELLRNRLMPAFINAGHASDLVDRGLGAVSIGFWSGADGSTCTASNPAPTPSQVAAAAGAYPAGLHLYAYTADEISHCSSLLPTMQQYADALHSAGVDQLITMPPRTDWAGVVDIWVELPKQYVASDVQNAIGRGEVVWSYNCLVQDNYSPKWEIDFAPINYRIQPGFINQSLKMTGLLYWRADYWTADPWNDVSRYSDSYPGEGLLVYPAEQVGIQGVMPSMRLKWLRDGVDDYDYVQILKENGEAGWALSIAQSIGPDWTNWTRETNALETARQQLGDKIHGLSAPHALSVSAIASPSTVPSAGQTQLSATATDSFGHAIASWSWSDGGAGGLFSPSAQVQNPTYHAPANETGSDITIQLIVVATCDGDPSVSTSATTNLTVEPTPHTLSVTALADPTSVESSGAVSLSAVATDSLDHGIAAWSWSDGGAGGSFSPSASVQSPTYTAPANMGDDPREIALTVTAVCNGSTPASATDTTVIRVNPINHHLIVTATATPETVASGGTTSLSAIAEDSHGHTIAAWYWSDGAAGGAFSPSANVKDPMYVAPENTSDSALTVQLTVSAVCTGPMPLTASSGVSIIVQPVVPTLTVTAEPPSPSTVGSEETAELSAVVEGILEEDIIIWQWDDADADGVFMPSAAVRNPHYRAPRNSSGQQMSVNLTVQATREGIVAATDTDTTELIVQPAEHTLTVSAGVEPSVVSWKGRAQLAARADDTLGHAIAEWHWSDGGAGGTFLPSHTVQYPTYRVEPNTTVGDNIVVLTVTAICDCVDSLSATGYAILRVEPKPNLKTRTASAGHFDDLSDYVITTPTIWRTDESTTIFSDIDADSWAIDAILACRDAGIINGYPDGTYRPELSVSRSQIAVYISRALAGSDEAIPPGPATPTFDDVSRTHWAYRYIEFAKEWDVIDGFPNGYYYPSQEVTRAEIAAVIARSLEVRNDTDMLASYQAPDTPTFSDVPADFWGYPYIEFLAERGILLGREDGSFSPNESCTRAETATYLARAFELSS